MNSKKLMLSIRLDFTDKATKEDLSKSGRGWTDSELDLEQFIDHIKNGYAIKNGMTTCMVELSQKSHSKKKPIETTT